MFICLFATLSPSVFYSAVLSMSANVCMRLYAILSSYVMSCDILSSSVLPMCMCSINVSVFYLVFRFLVLSCLIFVCPLKGYVLVGYFSLFFSVYLLVTVFCLAFFCALLSCPAHMYVSLCYLAILCAVYEYVPICYPVLLSLLSCHPLSCHLLYDLTISYPPMSCP